MCSIAASEDRSRASGRTRLDSGKKNYAWFVSGVNQRRHVPGDVAAAVGSPNIVTQDADGNDTWIYDKISTETSHSDSSQSKNTSVSAGGGVLGAIGSVLGGVVGGVSQSQGSSSGSGAASQSQKTLTVVIKFNQSRQVSTVRYQSSSF